MQRIRSELILAAGFRCRECGDERPWGDLEIDHIQPIHAGGEWWDRDNLQVLCTDCHAEKTEAELGRERTPAEREWDLFVNELESGGGSAPETTGVAGECRYAGARFNEAGADPARTLGGTTV